MDDYDGVLPSSLQPWTRASSQPKSFGAVLGRIHAERGHFRHITEAQLRDEIAANAVSGPPSPSDSDSDDPDAKDGAASRAPRAEQLAQARREVIEHVASAQNETLLALDFISLLLSKDVKQAETTISPILKQSVPLGTLGLDVWAGINTDPKQEETDMLLARGKRMQSLTQSADALMAAGERLKTTVDRERRYWDEVLRVRESGWSVCRMPREKGMLGVRYGFSEAKGEFGRRGLAALRMDGEGNVVLDRGLGTEGKALRVRIVQDGTVKHETSIKSSLYDDGAQVDVTSRIRIARDSLFEEELWHEAMREARTLGSYGVKMNGNTITMPSSYTDTQADGNALPSQTIEVDLVSLDSASPSTKSDALADGIATTLRLLLLHTHRQRLENRSAVPAPLSSAQVQKPIASILRPLLSTLHHQAATTQLDEQLSNIRALLAKAHLTGTQSSTNALESSLQAVTSTKALLSLLCAPRESGTTLNIRLPSPTPSEPTDLTLRIKTTTHLAPPAGQGSTFAITCQRYPVFDRETASLGAMVAHIGAMLTCALTDAAGEWLSGWDRDLMRGVVVQPVGLRDGGAGEVSVSCDDEEREMRLVVRVGEERYEWKVDGGEEKSFADVMDEVKGKEG